MLCAYSSGHTNIELPHAITSNLDGTKQTLEVGHDYWSEGVRNGLCGDVLLHPIEGYGVNIEMRVLSVFPPRVKAPSGFFAQWSGSPIHGQYCV